MHHNEAFWYGAEMLSFPGSKGMIWRIEDGVICISIIEIKAEEIPQRERIVPIIDDFKGMYRRSIDELEGLFKPLGMSEVE